MGGGGEGGGVAGTTVRPVTVALVTFTIPPVNTCIGQTNVYVYVF